MRIYVSGTFAARERLRPQAEALRLMGHEITGDWLYEPARPAQLNDSEWNRVLAEKDIAQVYAAECIILDLDGESTTGGRYVEWGVACYPGSMRRRYIVGGQKPGVFDYMAHRRFDTWADLLSYFTMTHAPR
jgi:hypothetical protein